MRDPETVKQQQLQTLTYLCSKRVGSRIVDDVSRKHFLRNGSVFLPREQAGLDGEELKKIKDLHTRLFERPNGFVVHGSNGSRLAQLVVGDNGLAKSRSSTAAAVFRESVAIPSNEDLAILSGFMNKIASACGLPRVYLTAPMFMLCFAGQKPQQWHQDAASSKLGVVVALEIQHRPSSRRSRRTRTSNIYGVSR